MALALALSAVMFACGGETIVVQTVEVEKVVERAVPQTVVVEREVEVAGETVDSDRRRRKRGPNSW